MPCVEIVLTSGESLYGAVLQRTADGRLYIHGVDGVVHEIEPSDVTEVRLATKPEE